MPLGKKLDYMPPTYRIRQEAQRQKVGQAYKDMLAAGVKPRISPSGSDIIIDASDPRQRQYAQLRFADVMASKGWTLDQAIQGSNKLRASYKPTNPFMRNLISAGLMAGIGYVAGGSMGLFGGGTGASTGAGAGAGAGAATAAGTAAKVGTGMTLADWLAIGNTASGLWGANKQAKAANAATDAQNRGLDWQQNMFSEFTSPFLRAGVTQQPQYQDWWQNMAGGQGNQNPWFLQTPGTSGPDWENMVNAYSTLGNLGLDRARQGEQSNLASYYASKGVPMSQQQTGELPGFQRWWNQALSEENANRALGLDQLANQRRSMGQNVLGMLGSAASTPGATAATWGGLAGERAAAAGNQAAQYGQGFSNTMAGMAQSLGQYLAYSQWLKGQGGTGQTNQGSLNGPAYLQGNFP